MRRRHRSYDEQIVKTLAVNRYRVEIRVDDDGFFAAHVAGEWIKEETMKAAIARITSLTRKTKIVVAVPVSVFNGGEVKDVVLTGFDADGDVLYRSDAVDEPKKPLAWRRGRDHGKLNLILRGYGLEGLARRLTKDERAEYARLVKAQNAAERARDAFVAKRAIKDAKARVEAAIAEQVDTPVEPAEESEDPR